MAKYPAMPLWTDAYLADTTHLSDAEHGRYLMLLVHMWRSPARRFPNDRAWLERKFKRAPEAFDAEIQPLLDEFCQCDGNWWTQKKLLKVWREVQRTCAKQSARAKARWNKEKDECRGNAAAAMQPKPKPLESKTPPTTPTEPTVPSECRPQGGDQQTNGHAKPKKERGSRLTSEWQPSERAIAYCRNDLGCSAEKLNFEFGAFMDWALGSSSPNTVKRDWDRTFVNWIRKEMKRVREAEAREQSRRARWGGTAH